MASQPKPPASATTILQVLPALHSGGVERGTLEINEAIRKRGWNSVVASSSGQLAPSIAYCGGEHITLPLHSKNPWVIWRNSHRLAKIIRERKVSIIHARSRAPAWSAWMAAKRTGIPFMTTFHGVYKNQNDWKKRYNSIMARGQRVIAVSGFIYDHLIKNYGVEPGRIRLIHRGVDLRLFSPDKVVGERLAELLTEWRLPEEEPPIILLPGRITRWKGHEVLIEALASIKHTPFLALFLGDDNGHETYRQELEQRIIQNGLTGKVRFVPPTNKMTEAYTLADIVVAPSIEPEAFGRVTVEAQAMGKIVITTAHGGAMETVQPGMTGFLVQPGNAQELAGAILFSLEMDEPTRNAMQEEARAHAAEHFSAEAMRQATIRVYEELL